MAKKKSKDVESNERAVDVEALEPRLQPIALRLGFRKRVSVNKVARTILEEEKHARVGKVFTGVMVGGTVAFLALSFAGPVSLHGKALGVAIFAAFWTLIGFVYTRQARRHKVELLEIDAVVKQMLGL